MKNLDLNRWLWKWHVIAGLITMPFMIILAVTGVIYLFKADVNEQLYRSTLYVEAPSDNAIKLGLNEQFSAAIKYSENRISAINIPTDTEQSTEFEIRSKGFAKTLLYVNPYTAENLGVIDTKQTLMRKVRKLHGELLLDTPGTLVIELVASWFLVLILTGIYVWWPSKINGAGGFFTIRMNKSKRLFWRDLHAVSAFWISILLAATLAGAMPWTNVFGSNLKWVQEQTDSGYPQNWRHAKGLMSNTPDNETPLTIEQVVTIANKHNLLGKVTIKLPVSTSGVFTVSNNSLWLSDQEVIHIDQYTGDVVLSYTWDDVGILMDLRQVFMRFHQGEYGIVNWVVMLIVGLVFFVMNLAGTISYLKRKQKGDWSIPKVPSRFKVDVFLVSFILFLGLLFPLFGMSIIVIWLWELRKKITNKPKI